jgi:hypothetical protein
MDFHLRPLSHSLPRRRKKRRRDKTRVFARKNRLDIRYQFVKFPATL